MTRKTEGGLRASRIEYVPESSQGVTPADPAWQRASDRYTDFSADFGPDLVEKFGLGDIDPEYEPGLEEPEVSLSYDMQQWFLDGTGDPQDIAGYGMVRQANILPSSLTVVERIKSGDVTENQTVEPESTVHYRYNDDPAATAKEARVYTVAKGADVGEATINGNPDDVDFAIDCTLPCEHGRSYQIDQPTAATGITVRSTDAGDTTQDVIIESDGATVTDTVTLNGTTVVGTTLETFDSIDAIEVVETGTSEPADHVGDIVVSINDGTAAAPVEGEAVSVLYGSDHYGNTYGDPGIPTLGAGSHSAAINSAYYKVGNMSVERPTGTEFEAAGSVQSVELSITNETERSPINNSREQRTHHGTRGTEFSVTADGETISHDKLVERNAGVGLDTLLGFNRAQTETITLERAVVTDSPRERSAGDLGTEQEFTLAAQRQTGGGAAITITPESA